MGKLTVGAAVWLPTEATTYVWDDASNLTDIRLSGSASLAAFAYDSYGRRTGLTRGNGTVSSYAYDDRSSLSTLGLDLASTGNDQTATFTRDVFARITKKASSNAAYVAAAPSAASLSYSPNGLNQITTGAGVSWTHDGRGNATAIGANTFTYDTANRMTAKTSASVTLAYDPVGRLYEHAGVSTTRFQYDNADLITEYNTGGTVLRRYVHGPGEDEPLVWFEGSGTGTPHYLLADERGSIAAVTDASGVAEAINTYDEYGSPSTTSATYASRFRYTGQTWFSDLGLYNYKARMYAPDFGRFLQTDPIGYGDGLNMYAYVGNDPVNRRDPTGTECLYNGAPIPCGDATSIDTGRECSPFDDRCILTPSCQSLCDSPDGGSSGGGGFAQSPLQFAGPVTLPKTCPVVSAGGVGKYGQWQAAMAFPNQAIIAKILSSEAVKATSKEFSGPGLHNGTGDAYRHFYWSYEMTKVLGKGFPKLFGDSHEVSGSGSNEETEMDAYNNAMGREYASDPDNKFSSTDAAARSALSGGCFVTIPGK